MRTILLAAVLTFGAPLVSRAAPSADETKLATARVAAAHKAYDVIAARFKSGQAKLEDVYTWSLRLLDADSDPAAGAASKTAATDHAKRMHELQTTVASQIKAVMLPTSEGDLVNYYVVDADLRVARAKH